MRKSDLMIENFGYAKPLWFPAAKKYTKNGIPIYKAAKNGISYHSMICGKIWKSPFSEKNKVSAVLSEILSEYTNHLQKRPSRILFAGLGNQSVSSDALGPSICDKLIITGHDPVMKKAGFSEIYSLKPGVESRSGIKTADHVKLIADHVNADMIFTADSLCAALPERLHTLIQITDSGITPGSALSHSSAEISKKTMNRPVISIGVPAVISAAAMLDAPSEERFFVTRPDIADIISCYSSIISHALIITFMGKNDI